MAFCDGKSIPWFQAKAMNIVGQWFFLAIDTPH